MSRKARTDSLAGDRRAIAGAMAPPVQPPAHVHLRDQDWPFWFAIVGARTREKWDELDLAHAANLARTQADIEKLQEKLDIEGHTVTSLKGTPIANPLHAIIETLTRRAVALSRALHVHAEAKQGKAKLQGNAKSKQDEAKRHLENSDEDLVPRAPH